jgi:aminoglycoside 2'-N-acetyltransferase I
MGDTSTEFKVVAHRDLTPDQDRLLDSWKNVLFGRYEGEPRDWATPDWHVFMSVDGRVVCHAQLTDRKIRAGDQPLRVAGVGAVMTPAEHQGKGYAKMIMRETTTFFCQSLKVDFGFLFCFQKLVPLYQKCGWQEIPARVYYQQSSGRTGWLYAAMNHPARKSDWPDGEVDLCGFPW